MDFIFIFKNSVIVLLKGFVFHLILFCPLKPLTFLQIGLQVKDHSTIFYKDI